MTSKSAKEILSYVRKGDFAHPGEIDAIEMALKPISKDKTQLVLDVGSGLGGTAHYVQTHEWGRVTGLDLDNELVQYAILNYPDTDFICSDILYAHEHISQKFDLIYSFNAFFCFKSQTQALKQMTYFANPRANLVIFDYSRFSKAAYQSPFPWSSTASQFNPIYLPEFERWLFDAGWQLREVVDVTTHFEKWYAQLLQSFESNRADILKQFDFELLDKMVAGYSQLLRDIELHQIGGIVIYADKAL